MNLLKSDSLPASLKFSIFTTVRLDDRTSIKYDLMHMSDFVKPTTFEISVRECLRKIPQRGIYDRYMATMKLM